MSEPLLAYANRLVIQPPLIAAQLLTRIPVSLAHTPEPRDLGRSLVWYPVVGALIGWLMGRSGAGLLGFAVGLYPAVVLVLLVGVLITGAMHEDGLADTADAMGGGRDATDILCIMRDSRIGTYGAIALITVFALRGAFLLDLRPSAWVPALVCAHACARLSCVLLVLALPYARTDRPGLAALLAQGGKPVHGMLALVVAAIICVLSASMVRALLVPQMAQAV